MGLNQKTKKLSLLQRWQNKIANLKRKGPAYYLFQRFLLLSRKFLKISAQESFSQFGEDIILRYIFQDKVFVENQPGFFVDVGCNHPIDGNNCYFFYTRGWKGINIDGNATLIKKYLKQRQGDISLCLLISDEEKEVDFFVMEDDKISSMDVSFIEQFPRDFSKADKVVLRTRTLTSVLDEHLNKNQKIDFLNVDVEGHDLQVLRSLDFSRYTPAIVVVEISVANVQQVQNHPITSFLNSLGYELIYFSVLTAFFEHKSRRSPQLS